MSDKLLEQRERDLATLERWMNAHPDEDIVVRFAVWDRVLYLKDWIAERKHKSTEPGLE